MYAHCRPRYRLCAPLVHNVRVFFPCWPFQVMPRKVAPLAHPFWPLLCIIYISWLIVVLNSFVHFSGLPCAGNTYLVWMLLHLLVMFMYFPFLLMVVAWWLLNVGVNSYFLNYEVRGACHVVLWVVSHLMNVPLWSILRCLNCSV